MRLISLLILAASGCSDRRLDLAGLPLDLSMRPDLLIKPDLAVAPDLADLQPPPTIGVEISSFTGVDIVGDKKSLSFPLPTPTQVPIDGVSYVFKGLQAGQYD